MSTFLFIDSNSHHYDFQNYQFFLKAVKLVTLNYISYGLMRAPRLVLGSDELDA